MRRSLRFLSSCSSSSVIAGILVQPEEVALHAVQNHPFQAVQVVEAIAEGFSHGGQERLSGIFAHEAKQLTQGQHHQLAAMLFQRGEVISDLRYRWRMACSSGCASLRLSPWPRGGRWATSVMR